MNIKEAIRIQELDLSLPGTVDVGKQREAQQLGIEALKRERDRRSLAFSRLWGALPGETVE